MIKELCYKWFGLTPPSCKTCEILRDQLDESNRERRDLLNRLLEAGKPESVVATVKEEEPQPVGHSFTPWRVKQQMLEAEDRKTASLMREKMEEINELEKKVGL